MILVLSITLAKATLDCIVSLPAHRNRCSSAYLPLQTTVFVIADLGNVGILMCAKCPPRIEAALALERSEHQACKSRCRDLSTAVMEASDRAAATEQLLEETEARHVAELAGAEERALAREEVRHGRKLEWSKFCHACGCASRVRDSRATRPFQMF